MSIDFNLDADTMHEGLGLTHGQKDTVVSRLLKECPAPEKPFLPLSTLLALQSHYAWTEAEWTLAIWMISSATERNRLRYGLPLKGAL